MTHTVGSLWAPTKPCAVNAFADCVHPSLHLLTSVLLQCAIPCSEDVPWACRSVHSLLYLLVSSNTGKPVMVQYHFFVFVSLRSFLSASNWRMSSRREVQCLRYVHVHLPNLWNDSAQYKCFLHQHEPKAGASGALGGDPALGKNKHALVRAYQASVQRPYTYDSQRARVQRWSQFLLGNCLDSFVFAYLFMHCFNFQPCFNFPWLPNAVAPSNCRLRSDSSACCSKALTFHHGPLMIPVPAK